MFAMPPTPHNDNLRFVKTAFYCAVWIALCAYLVNKHLAAIDELAAKAHLSTAPTPFFHYINPTVAHVISSLRWLWWTMMLVPLPIIFMAAWHWPSPIELIARFFRPPSNLYERLVTPPRCCPCCQHHFIPWNAFLITRWSTIRCPACQARLTRHPRLKPTLFSRLLLLSWVVFVASDWIPHDWRSLCIAGFALYIVLALTEAITIPLAPAGSWRGWLKGYVSPSHRLPPPVPVLHPADDAQSQADQLARMYRL